MEDLFTGYWPDVSVKLPPPRAVQSAARLPARPRASAPTEAHVVRPFVNPESNGRLAASLGLPAAAGALKIRWTAPLPDWIRPNWILASGNHILVQGRRGWRLFEGSRHLAEGRLRHSEVALDPSGGRFFFGDEHGRLMAAPLGAGGSLFDVSLYSTAQFDHKFMTVHGSRLLVLSSRLWLDQDAPEPQLSYMEAANLADPTGPKVVRELVRQSKHLVAAAHGDSIVLGTDDHLCLADLDLNVRDLLTARFTPLAVSLDEAGWIYLVATVGERTELWVLTPRGERAFSFAAPQGASVSTPAIVGYDHTAYLLTGSEILGIRPDGSPLWSKPAGIGAAVATADGWLLASQGSSIVGWNEAGDRAIIHNLPGEQLVTPPVLASGTVLVASNSSLYCLA